MSRTVRIFIVIFAALVIFGPTARASQPAVVDTLGACCFDTPPYCRILTDTECSQQGGWMFWPGYDCDPSPCMQFGACCLDDGQCMETTDETCLSYGGWFFVDQACDPGPCVEGSCCVGTFCYIWYQWQCNESWIAGGTCDPNPCIPPGTGACCLSDGNCQILSPEDCAGAQGVFMGVGVLCYPYPCPPVPAEKTTWGRIKEQYREHVQ